MHRFWLNQDIFVLILEALDKTSRRKVLSTLARTCRALYDPSMDALWSVMGDVSPLVKCMPDSSWKISKMPLGLGRQSPALYLLDPNVEDWEHFAKHAHRVKELSICTMGPTGPTDTFISGFLLSAISAYACEYSRTSGPLFPNLRTLSCDIYSSGRESLSCIPYLAGPDLSALRMSTNRSVVTVAHNLSPLSDILARVQESAPSLDHLEVSFNPPYQLPQSSADFLLVIGEFQEDQLSSLTLHFEFQKKLLHKFALGRRLTTLNLSLHHVRVDDIRFDRTSVFDALQDLTFHTCNIDVATALLNTITTPRLQTLAIHCESFCDARAMWHLCQAVARHQHLKSLLMHSMARFTVFTMDRIPRFDMLEALEPLLALSNIESFALEGVVYVDIRDRYFVPFGKAWPHLRSLTLAVKPLQPTLGVAMDSMVLPSVHALRLIPEYFPQLLALGIPVSQTVADPEDFRRKSSTRGRLNTIRFYASPLFLVDPSQQMNADDLLELLDPGKLADFLQMLFPELTAVKGPPATGPWWPTVYSQVLVAKNVEKAKIS